VHRMAGMYVEFVSVGQHLLLIGVEADVINVPMARARHPTCDLQNDPSARKLDRFCEYSRAAREGVPHVDRIAMLFDCTLEVIQCWLAAVESA